jgi:hypothetical protein
MTTTSSRRTAIRAVLALALSAPGVLLIAPTVLADTCCANVPTGFQPRSAHPGEVVTVTGLQCLNADNSGPLPLKPGAFWLSGDRRPAEPDPGSVPGLDLPFPDLPPVETWPSFATVPDPSAAVGSATIIVPDLAAGTYQLWWWCDDGSGPGGGIHYSTGPRLIVGVPDTATESAGIGVPSSAPGWPGGLLVLATASCLGIVRWGPFGVRFDTRRRVRG